MYSDNAEISLQDCLSVVSQNSKVGIKMQITFIRGMKQLEEKLGKCLFSCKLLLYY